MLVYAVNINLDVWKSLPADIQVVMEDVVSELSDLYTLWLIRDEVKFEKIFKDAGIKFYELSAADTEAWRAKIVREGYETYVKRVEGMGYPNAREIMDRYAELLGWDPYEYPMP